MAGKTLGDRILDLERVVYAVEKQQERIDTSVDALGRAHLDFRKEVADLHREYDIAIALLKKELDDLKAWKAEQKQDRAELSRRAWAFGPSIIGAVISVLLAALVARLVAG